MSLTNPKDFDIFYSLIPKEIRKDVWFFPLRSNRKNPECAAGTILKGNLAYRLSYDEAKQRLLWGSNVGIYAITNGLMFLDLDVSEGKIIASKDFLDALESNNNTLTIKTRNGGLQYYFLNNGKYANQVLKENGVTIGELRTDWFYVVSVGSHVEPDSNCLGEPDGTYRVKKETPITQFKPFGDYFKLNDGNTKEPIKTFTKKGEFQTVTYEEHITKINKKNMIKRTCSKTELKMLRCLYD